MRSALIPGSFDPVTRGHADVIRRVAAHFDRVYVAVMHNDMNRYVAGAAVKQYLFSAEERVQMVRLACTGLENVEVFADGGLLIDLVDRLGVDWIVKGIRSEEDYRYEQCHALWNRVTTPAPRRCTCRPTRRSPMSAPRWCGRNWRRGGCRTNCFPRRLPRIYGKPARRQGRERLIVPRRGILPPLYRKLKTEEERKPCRT